MPIYEYVCGRCDAGLAYSLPVTVDRDLRRRTYRLRFRLLVLLASFVALAVAGCTGGSEKGPNDTVTEESPRSGGPEEKASDDVNEESAESDRGQAITPPARTDNESDPYALGLLIPNTRVISNLWGDTSGLTNASFDERNRELIVLFNIESGSVVVSAKLFESPTAASEGFRARRDSGLVSASEHEDLSLGDEAVRFTGDDLTGIVVRRDRAVSTVLSDLKTTSDPEGVSASAFKTASLFVLQVDFLGLFDYRPSDLSDFTPGLSARAEQEVIESLGGALRDLRSELTAGGSGIPPGLADGLATCETARDFDVGETWALIALPCIGLLVASESLLAGDVDSALQQIQSALRSLE